MLPENVGPLELCSGPNRSQSCSIIKGVGVVVSLLSVRCELLGAPIKRRSVEFMGIMCYIASNLSRNGYDMGPDEVSRADFRCNRHFKTSPVDLDGSPGVFWPRKDGKSAISD